MSRSLLSHSHICRRGRVASAVVSEENAITSSLSDSGGFKLTYLEVGFHFLIGLSHI